MPRRSTPRPPRDRMRSSYVAIHQQVLAFACVLAVAITAAGVLRLDITDRAPDARTLSPAIRTGDAYVATRPVAPKVREVAAKVAPAKAADQSRRSAGSSTSARVPRLGGLPLVTTSAPQPVQGFATVGATWAESDPIAEDAIRLQVRTEKAGRWSGWEKLEYHDDHGPDQGERDGDRTLRQGTEPSVVGEVDRAQFRIFSSLGRAPRALRWVTVDPGQDKVVKRAPAIDTATLASTKRTERQESEQSGISLAAMKQAPKPKIYSRAQWGADERIRESGNPSYGTIKTGFVHHTVNANNYTSAQVPALLRSIYAYHVKSRGWRDIGYNFLVDRFGRIWEGRFGGVDKAVVGAHTLGYNEVSFAMSAIGNFDTVQPPQAVLDAYAQLFAWKLSKYNIKANATGLSVKGKTLRAINGHRDVGQTACPGKYLYAKLPEIRTMAAKIQAGAGSGSGSGGSTASPSPTPTQAPTTQGMPMAADKLRATKRILGSTWPDLVLRGKSGTSDRVLPLAAPRLQAGTPVTSTGSWSALKSLAGVGDVTGDGRGDLLLLSKNGRSYVRSGDGAGRTSDPRFPSTAFADADWVSGAGDLDGDKHADVVSGDGKTVWLSRGTGTGEFASRTKLLAWTGGRLVGAGDQDGDGHADLLGIDDQHKLVRFAGTGQGTVSASPTVLTTVASGSRLLGLGDVTGDGVPDVLLGQSGGAVSALPTRAGGAVGAALTALPAQSGTTWVGAGSLLAGSAAGKGLALFGTAEKGLVVRSLTLRAATGEAVVGGLSLTGASQVLAAGDWDGDGKADLVVRSKDKDTFSLRRGTGSGGFGSPVTMKTGWAKLTGVSVAGDVNADGHPDLYAITSSGAPRVLLGDGKHGFLGAVTPPSGMRSFNQVGGTGLWKPTDKTARVLSADGSFAPYLGQDAATLVKTYDWVLARGDATGDGVADLVVRERSSGRLYVLPGAPGGHGTRVLLAPGGGGFDLVG